MRLKRLLSVITDLQWIKVIYFAPILTFGTIIQSFKTEAPKLFFPINHFQNLARNRMKFFD